MDAVSWIMYIVFNTQYGFLTENGYSKNVKLAKLFAEPNHADIAITSSYENVIQVRITLEDWQA